MRPRAAACALAATAAAGLAAAPAAAGGVGATFVEICTGRGPAWVKLSADAPSPFAPERKTGLNGCAHMLCPRGLKPQRGKGRGRP